MIEGMYDVMQFINDIKKRFGLTRHNVKTEAEMPASNFRDELFNIERVKKQDLLISGKDPAEYTKDDINKIADHFARKNKIPEALVRSMISVESSYNPLAVSPKGAMGLMQIMPVVAGEMNVNDPFSPEQNVEAGTGYFKKLLNYYDEDYTKALAAYNAGMGTVDRAGGVPNINETKRYIDKVVATYLENSKR